MVRVAAGGRLHFGFGNLSLSHERLYGALGVGLDTPEAVVEATPAETVVCDDATVRNYAARATDLLDVSGAAQDLEPRLERLFRAGRGGDQARVEERGPVEPDRRALQGDR